MALKQRPETPKMVKKDTKMGITVTHLNKENCQNNNRDIGSSSIHEKMGFEIQTRDISITPMRASVITGCPKECYYSCSCSLVPYLTSLMLSNDHVIGCLVSINHHSRFLKRLWQPFVFAILPSCTTELISCSKRS